MTDEHIFSNESISAADTGEQSVRADHVEIKQGGANSVDAETVSIQQGGAGHIRANDLTLEQSGVGLARAGTARIGGNSGALAVVADEATIEEGGNVLILLARRVSGDARPIIDLPTAIGIGAGFAVVWSLLRRLR